LRVFKHLSGELRPVHFLAGRWQFAVAHSLGVSFPVTMKRNGVAPSRDHAAMMPAAKSIAETWKRPVARGFPCRSALAMAALQGWPGPPACGAAMVARILTPSCRLASQAMPGKPTGKTTRFNGATP
jgi:hypothetical protein